MRLVVCDWAYNANTKYIIATFKFGAGLALLF